MDVRNRRSVKKTSISLIACGLFLGGCSGQKKITFRDSESDQPLKGLKVTKYELKKPFFWSPVGEFSPTEIFTTDANGQVEAPGGSSLQPVVESGYSVDYRKTKEEESKNGRGQIIYVIRRG